VINLAFIRCPNGVLRDYAEYEDKIKPLWKEKMRKEFFKRSKFFFIYVILTILTCVVILGLCAKLSLFLFKEIHYLFMLLSYFLFVLLIISIYCIVSGYISEKKHKSNYD